MADSPVFNEWHKTLPRSPRSHIMLGLGVVAICCIGFGAWAFYAPLDGAVVASGSFVATGQNKQVQHLEGGVLKEVLVSEGETVEAGQVLARLDGTAAKSHLRRLIVRRYRLLLARSRLEAQIRGEKAFAVPAALKPLEGDADVAALIERQKLELDAERKRLWSEKEVLRKEIAGLQESIVGNEAQLRSAENKLGLFQEELEYKTKLLERQLTRRTEVLAIRRAEAELTGTVGALNGRIADARERIARAEQQIASLDASRTQKSVEELRATETDLDDIDEQIHAARDIVDRIDVRAPVRGAVVTINNQTIGGVISPGGTIMELVPVDAELVVETRVSPREINHIERGQDALVRLTALNRRATPMITGKVVYLSADAVPEPMFGREQERRDNSRGQSFVVRVQVDQGDLKSKVPNFQSSPGMPADVYIQTGERTFFDYLMRPVFDSFSRAFKEA